MTKTKLFEHILRESGASDYDTVFNALASAIDKKYGLKLEQFDSQRHQRGRTEKEWDPESSPNKNILSIRKEDLGTGKYKIEIDTTVIARNYSNREYNGAAVVKQVLNKDVKYNDYTRDLDKAMKKLYEDCVKPTLEEMGYEIEKEYVDNDITLVIAGVEHKNASAYGMALNGEGWCNKVIEAFAKKYGYTKCSDWPGEKTSKKLYWKGSAAAVFNIWAGRRDERPSVYGAIYSFDDEDDDIVHFEVRRTEATADIEAAANELYNSMR